MLRKNRSASFSASAGNPGETVAARFSHHRRSAARRRDRPDEQFSTEGRRLWRLARGIDDRLVVPDRGAKTISSETTFETDIRDFATLEKLLWRLSEKVSARLKNGDLSGLTITLKLKTADFRQRTRSQSIHAPTQLAAKIFAVTRKCWRRKSTALHSA